MTFYNRDVYWLFILTLCACVSQSSCGSKFYFLRLCVCKILIYKQSTFVSVNQHFSKKGHNSLFSYAHLTCYNEIYIWVFVEVYKMLFERLSFSSWIFLSFLFLVLFKDKFIKYFGDKIVTLYKHFFFQMNKKMRML